MGEHHGLLWMRRDVEVCGFWAMTAIIGEIRMLEVKDCIEQGDITTEKSLSPKDRESR